MNNDYIELQGKINQAVIDNSVVEITRDYVIDYPLVMARFEDGEYKQHSAKIIGNSTMWDVSNGNIKATFSDAPILSIHKGKGNIVKGLNISGTGIGRDSRYSPYTALAIDPICGFLPPDGGYPGLKEFYQGSESKSGSTGIRIEDCTFNNVTVGSITSPNGHTQNAELITYQNIRIGKVKHGIAGCQAQEKLNRIINIGAWDECETLFRFNTYGECSSGQWVIDGVNVAGNVKELIYRSSHGYFPLFMMNVFAESLKRIGYWQSFVGDTMQNISIDFAYPEETTLPDYHLEGGGVKIQNGQIRYYGQEYPVILKGGRSDQGGWFSYENVKSTEVQNLESSIILGGDYEPPKGVKKSDCFYAEVENGQIKAKIKDCRYALFMDDSFTLKGWAIMEKKEIKYKSESIADGWYKIYLNEKA